MTANTKTAEPKKAPVAKIRVGSVTANIWENVTDKGTFRNVTVESRYKDGDGNWRSSRSFKLSELLALAKAVDMAHTRIIDALSAAAAANAEPEVQPEDDEIPF